MNFGSGQFHDPFDMFQDFFGDAFGDQMFNGRFKHFDDLFEDMEGGGEGIDIDDLFGGFGFGGGGGGGFGSFMSQSSSTSYVNGKKVTTISMNKNGKQIQEVYENDELVERKINGKIQNLDAIEGGDGNKNDDVTKEKKKSKKQRVKKKKRQHRKEQPNVYAHKAVYSFNLDLGWYALIIPILCIACLYWFCCLGGSDDRHEHRN